VDAETYVIDHSSTHQLISLRMQYSTFIRCTYPTSVQHLFERANAKISPPQKRELWDASVGQYSTVSIKTKFIPPRGAVERCVEMRLGDDLPDEGG